VGAVDEATIKAYIENQKWDQNDQGFKVSQRPPSLEPTLSRNTLQTASAAHLDF